MSVGIEFEFIIPVRVRNVRQGGEDVIDSEKDGMDGIFLFVTVEDRGGESVEAMTDRALDVLREGLQSCIDSVSKS